jgi:hypothetical protein
MYWKLLYLLGAGTMIYISRIVYGVVIRARAKNIGIFRDDRRQNDWR